MSLPTAQLGKHGPPVPRLGLGLMGLSFFYGKLKPDAERLALLDHAHAVGERWWESSDFYGDSEVLLGTWFRANPEKRKDIFLSTKVGAFITDKGFTIDSSAKHVREACEKSLSRLGVDSIDLYYLHRLDGKTAVEESMRELIKLQKEGKIKYLGISECSVATLRRAHAVAALTAVQVEYSPTTLDIEQPEYGHLAAARELGIAIVAYSPLGRGLLTGTIRKPNFEEKDFRAAAPRFSAENFDKNLVLVDRLAAIAKAKGVTPGQLTLAWLLAQGDDIFPIPGTTRPERLDENLGALKVQLTPAETAEIRGVIKESVVVGHRYPEFAHSGLYVDTPAEK